MNLLTYYDRIFFEDMSEKNKEKKEKKTKKRLSKSALVLIIGLIIILIPIILFASILIIAALQTGTPREGSRFENDLDPAISNEQITQLENNLNSINNIENFEVILSEGQLKIFIDTNDNLNEEQVDNIVTDAYNKVNSVVPINTYFSATDTKKMYDLQINVFTTSQETETGDDSRQYKLLHKNSAEETYGIDDLAHPKNPTLVQELHGVVETQDNTEDEGVTEE